MLIPASQLSSQALRGLIEEFITREGTDYGDRAYTLEDKVTQVEQQLAAGDVVIVFNAEENSCTLLPCKEAEQALST
ncbi:MAG: YheU family protein [Pseudomonadales bacterium]